MSAAILTVMIQHEADVVTLRQRAREVAALLGFDGLSQTRIATAVSEIARNAFAYAGGGRAEFLVSGTGQALVIRIEDKGPGIADVAAILAGRQPPGPGRRSGIRGARRLVDRLAMQSEPGQGTTVVLEQMLPPTTQLTKKMLSRISNQLARQVPRPAIEEVQRQNQELLQTLAELRRRQEELSQLNHELEDTNRGVLALYAELDERAQRLRQADEVKSRFLSNMSHELRTPLNSIIALSSLLLARTDGELTAEQEKQVNYVRRSASNVLELVDDLLDLTKVEAGKITVYPKTFTVQELFSALRGMMRPLLSENTFASLPTPRENSGQASARDANSTSSVDLIFEQPDELPALHTDEGKVSQILRNLVSNALKFTEHGTVLVTAGYDRQQEAVVFSVADTGIGIAAADQERIFQEFSQLDHPIQQRVKGAGLGLPLSRKLAQLLGGRLTVQSEPGVGSTFLAVIPCVYVGEGEERLLDEGTPRSRETNQARILLIDDNETDRYIFQSALANTSYRVFEAINGAEGLRIARQEQPDIIFLDLVMPGMSGFQVLSTLKSEPATATIPVVILTSQSMEAGSAKELAQAAATLSKGYTSRTVVLDQIEAVLAGGA